MMQSPPTFSETAHNDRTTGLVHSTLPPWGEINQTYRVIVASPGAPRTTSALALEAWRMTGSVLIWILLGCSVVFFRTSNAPEWFWTVHSSFPYQTESRLVHRRVASFKGIGVTEEPAKPHKLFLVEDAVMQFRSNETRPLEVCLNRVVPALWHNTWIIPGPCGIINAQIGRDIGAVSHLQFNFFCKYLGWSSAVILYGEDALNKILSAWSLREA